MKNGGLRYSNASKDEEGKGISPILGERMEARAMTPIPRLLKVCDFRMLLSGIQTKLTGPPDENIRG
jgi:hypothetical protein